MWTKKRKVFIFLTILLIAIGIFSYKIIDQNKEKNLGELIIFDPSKVQSIIIDFEWNTEQKEQVEEFKDFLGQYRVKKMKDHEWNSDVSKEKGILVTVYIDNEIIMASIYENRLNLVNDGYYKVLNGPIDIDWINEIYIKEN